MLYIKSTLTGDEPPDILNFHRVHKSFPFDTTLDQFFTESQFESYRRLGKHVVATLMEDPDIKRIFDAGGRPPSPPGQKRAAPTPVDSIHRRRRKRLFG